MKRVLLLLGIVCFHALSYAGEKDTIASPKPATQSILTQDPEDDFSDIFKEELLPAVKEELAKAIESFDAVKSMRAFVDKLNANNIYEFPIGINENIGGVEYGIVVSKVKFKPEYAEMEMYARIVTPLRSKANDSLQTVDGRKALYFGVQGVKMSYKGKIIGDATLALLGDVNIPFNNDQWLFSIRGGSIADLTAEGTSKAKTYVVIDCDGIQDIVLKGEVLVSRNVLLPLDKENQVENGRDEEGIVKRVKGALDVKASDWNDILVKTTITPFAITKEVNNKERGYFTFRANDAVIDLSDERNDSSVVFPEYYTEKGFFVAGEESWRGFFLKSLEVGLPQEFKKKDNPKERVSLSARNLIIDQYGVSGSFGGSNIIQLKEGTTNERGGWAFSLDSIRVDIAALNLTGGYLTGKIQLPVQTKDGEEGEKGWNYLEYTGSVSNEEYLLNVELADTLNFNIFHAEAQIDKGSYVELKVENKNFKPIAVLNGQLAIKPMKEVADKVGEKLQIDGINFQELKIETEAPYLSAKYFGVQGKHNSQLMGFDITINEVGLERKSDDKVGLKVDYDLQLMSTGFSAKGAFSILGKINLPQVNLPAIHWKFDRIDFSKLGLDKVDTGLFKLSGSLTIMSDDPEYGDGFEADLTVSEIKGLNISISAHGIFGKKDFRYWAVDLLADNLNIKTGALNIDGIFGGAYYRMEMLEARTQQNTNKGLKYQPDEQTGLGLNAGIYGSFLDKKLASIMAQFSIITSYSGGLAYVGIMGEGVIMDDFKKHVSNPFDFIEEQTLHQLDKLNNNKALNKIANSELGEKYLDNKSVMSSDELFPKHSDEIWKAPFKVRLAISYDFTNSAFDGDFETFLNVANILKGVGQNDKLGWAKIHISPRAKYLYIGTPEDMIGIKAELGPVKIKVGGYFMVGDKLLDSPPPPARVAQILGVDLEKLDYMRDLNALESGKGVAFGAHFAFDTGDLSFLFLYARFAAGLGADVMLRDYGEAACANRNDKNIGINGWYANGQAYVYLEGELGIHLRLFFKKKKIPIIKAGVAALLQMKGPNPFWMRGYLGGRYSVLGGLVKGSFRFKMEFGKECVLANEDILGGLKIITDVRPDDNDTEVDVFSIPQATFAFKVNETFILPEDDGDHTYKILLERFIVTDDKGNEIPGRIEMGNNSDVINFVSTEVLPPQTKMKVVVEVSFQEKINGVFETLKDNGKKATEKEERTFTTGDAPTYIPESNIAYAYPVLNQKNFYKDESKQGYIVLDRGQDYLFSNTNWRTSTQFIDENEKVTESDFGYDKAKTTAYYNLPKGLKNQSPYHFRIIATSPHAGSSTTPVKDNKTVNFQNTGLFDPSSSDTTTTASYAKKEAELMAQDGEIERLSFNFRTSRYNVFRDKMNKIGRSFEYNWLPINDKLVYLVNNMNIDEPFELVELIGNKYTGNEPLIQVSATMNDKFAKRFKDLIYDKYPIQNIRLKREKNNKIGVPPIYALPIYQSYILYLENKDSHSFLKRQFPYKYMLFKYYSDDLNEYMIELFSQYINVPHSQRPKEVNDILNAKLGEIPEGRYDMKIQYFLPGNKKYNSSENLKYKFN